MLRRTTIGVTKIINRNPAVINQVTTSLHSNSNSFSIKLQQFSSLSSSSFTAHRRSSASIHVRQSIQLSLLNLKSKLVHYRSITTEPASLTKPVNNISSVFGPTSTPLDERTLGEFWDDLVASYPTSPALVCRHENSKLHSTSYKGGIWKEEDCLRYTFEEMGKKVDQLARGLMNSGFKKGDRVGVYAGNCSTYALLQWATAKVGIILVCINPASRGPELIAALNLSGCSALFIPPSLKKSAHITMLHTLLPNLHSTSSSSNTDGQVKELSDPGCPSLKRVFMIDNTELGAKGFANLLESEGLGGMDARSVLTYEAKEGETAIPWEKCYNSEVQNIQFSSGTTGLPKAIPLTSRNLLNNGILIGDYMNLRPPAPEEGWFGERLCNVPPMYHCFGIVLGNLAFWTHGACVIFAAEVFNPALTLRAVVQEKCTALHGVPTMFTAELALLDAIDEGKFVEGLSDLKEMDFSSMRTGIAAGSPVPAELAQKFAKRMNLKECVIVYGQTETSPGTVMSQTTDSMDLRCRTVGQVMPHTHIRIVDPSHDLYPSEETPSIAVGMPGEIWSGGYALQPGYWNNQEETDKAMFTDCNGIRWMRTGDQASMDKDGFITITGRIKDLIIRGGENLHPVRIEAKSLLLDGVSAVSIVAVPCSKFGEVVGAFVERSDSPSGSALVGMDLTNHITEIMSHQSAPSWVWFLGEDEVESEFPKTASGKIRKVELREWALELVKKEIGRTKIA